MKVAMVSEHASPLAMLGGVDAGGQNVHVACLASALADLGHSVTVYTRRDDPAAARRVSMRDGVDVVHLPCGPAAPRGGWGGGGGGGGGRARPSPASRSPGGCGRRR